MVTKTNKHFLFLFFKGISVLLIVMTVGQLSYGEIFTDKVSLTAVLKRSNSRW